MPTIGEAAVANRPLHFIWIIDKSGSMAIDGKMQSLNTAIKESIPEMVEIAKSNPFARMLIRTLTFSSGVAWELSEPTPVADFRWTDIEAEHQGLTYLGAALSELARELTKEKMGLRGYPPVLVLVTDGQASDNYKEGLAALKATDWGKRAVRIGIAIGRDADKQALTEFIGNPEYPVLHAGNPQTLAKYIRWASCTVSKSVTAPGSRPAENASPVGGQADGGGDVSDWVDPPAGDRNASVVPATSPSSTVGGMPAPPPAAGDDIW